MVQRCLCVLFVEYRSQYPKISTEDVASLILEAGLRGFDLDSCRKAVSAMMSYGSYYRNLELFLGKGAILVLGTEVAETT